MLELQVGTRFGDRMSKVVPAKMYQACRPTWGWVTCRKADWGVLVMLEIHKYCLHASKQINFL